MELEKIREHLDRLDNAITMLIAERQSFAPLVAEYKVEHNMPVFQPEREQKILNKKAELARQYGVDETLIIDIMKRIIEDSRRIQTPIIEGKSPE